MTVPMQRMLHAAENKNTARGAPWSIIIPYIVGAIIEPILKPDDTNPNTRPIGSERRHRAHQHVARWAA